MTWTQKVVLVTGGARGIGRTVVARALTAGARVACLDNDAAALARLAGTAPSAALLCLHGDVADEVAVDAAFTDLRSRFGRLDLLVCNAGIMLRRPLEELTRGEWERVLAVNLTGPWLCARAAAPLLREGGGAIVQIGSTRALMSEPGCEAYAASKGGLAALTHALAVSLGPEIRVNGIQPGWIETRAEGEDGPPLTEADHRQHPVGRVGRPEDVAELVMWLGSAEQSGFMTGQNLVLDGGMTRRMLYV